MRLRRLDLTRYGKFTDHVIDFGERPAGRPDLHIVYGPNEAGKSTALAAFLDLLFGIDPRTPYKFLHPSTALRIGASLELSGNVAEVVRLVGPQRSLLDGAGQSLSDHFLAAELGGLDRATYRAMFSLDDETLEAGGKSILASKGDAGQLLFSASAGLADFSRTLTDLRTATDAFHRPHARTSELSQLKAALASLKDQRDAIDTFAIGFSRLVETRDRTSQHYDQALAERRQLQGRRDEIQRHLATLPRLAALRALRTRLLPLMPLPDAPLGWLTDLPALQTEEIRLQTGAQSIDAERTRIEQEIAAIQLDETAYQLAGRLDHLAERRARHLTAERDIPARTRELHDVDLTIATILSRLDHAADPTPDRLLIPAAEIAALRELIETRSGIEKAAETAQDEVSDAVHRLGEARSSLHEAAGPQTTAQPAAHLATTLAALRTSDHAARQRVAIQARATQQRILADRMAALHPFSGDADHLATLPTPDTSTLQSWKQTAEQHRARIDRHRAEVDRLDDERARLKAELEAISAVAGIVTDQEAAAIRGARESAWSDHRKSLDPASADRFETALRRDDVVMAARLGHQRDVAKLHDTARTLAIRQAERDREHARLAAAIAEQRDLQTEIAKSLRSVAPDLAADTTPAQFESWMQRRDNALEARVALIQADVNLQNAEADAAAARARLLAALESAAVPHQRTADFESLLAIAQSALDREARLMSLRTAVEDRERDVTARERALQKAATVDRKWQAAWREACAACWLGENPTPTPPQVREILTALEALRPALEKRAGLAARIHDMQDDQAAFAHDLTEIARELCPDQCTSPILDLAQHIDDRIHAARAARAAHEQRLAARDSADRRRRTLDEAISLHARRKADMTAFFAVTSLIEVGTKLQEIEKKRDLRQQADQAEQDILEALRVTTIAAAEASLDTADRASLEGELSELDARLEDQDRRLQDLFAASKQASDRIDAIGGDEAAARIEEQRRTLLLEIEEKARHYLRLRVGTLAADLALRLYRDRHRSSMMQEASEAFKMISRQAYSGLTTRPEKDGDILIALTADGGSKIASDLSKGTRFQLYLALRAAGYQERTKHAPPVPFIADDIMETFDDFRAEEAFRLFARMATVGQVIYLTHHQHLCEIARRLEPTTPIHSLVTS